MNRLVASAIVLASATLLTRAAGAQPAKPKPVEPTLPSVGDTLLPSGAPSWPAKLDWLYDVPSMADATGKVVLHWFCAPKITTCTEDLARVVTLKENARVYIVAYINGTKTDAKKLDPIRETEGVGRGTVAFGKNVTALMKKLSLTGPVSLVVGLDNKVAFATTGTTPADLDARDQKVTALSNAIRDYTATSDGPKVVKPDDKFRLSISIKLASWLKYSKRTVPEFKLTAPADIKCDAKSLTGDQIKVADQTMTAQVSCSGSKGVYELRGTVTFGYDNPVSGGSGLGTESATWKFEIKPMGMQ
jgi:hypothetical protein